MAKYLIESNTWRKDLFGFVASVDLEPGGWSYALWFGEYESELIYEYGWKEAGIGSQRKMLRMRQGRKKPGTRYSLQKHTPDGLPQLGSS